MGFENRIVNYALLGSRICQRRKELKITQKKLGEKINVSSNHISGIETGEKKPSLETLLCICAELDVSLDYLVTGTVYTSVENEIIQKIRFCSMDNKKRISKIIDVFMKKINL